MNEPKKRGGAGRGQGARPTVEGGLSERRTFRLSKLQDDKMMSLAARAGVGWQKWLRDQIENAPDPKEKPE